MNDVPCNGCTACCQGGQRVVLRPGDDARNYLTVPNRRGIDGPIELMLAHKPNGDCVYHINKGCSIHGHAPEACREFDCRKWFAAFDDVQRLALLTIGIDRDIAIAAATRSVGPVA